MQTYIVETDTVKGYNKDKDVVGKEGYNTVTDACFYIYTDTASTVTNTNTDRKEILKTQPRILFEDQLHSDLSDLATD